MNTTTDVKKWLDDENEETIIEKMQRAGWALAAVANDPKIKELEYEIIEKSLNHIKTMLRDRNNANLLNK